MTDKSNISEILISLDKTMMINGTEGMTLPRTTLAFKVFESGFRYTTELPTSFCGITDTIYVALGFQALVSWIYFRFT